jgi:two-component system chemotaxis response regulator CheB
MHHVESTKIRVLIADDSFFIRTYLAELLRLDPEVEVVGAASSGDEVVALASALKPDVITMDYHMPGKNGIEATAAIMLGDRPLPAIIMLSAFSGSDGARVRKSLEASGAHVVVKPSGEVSLDIERVAGAIVKKVKEVGRIEVRVREAYERVRQSVHPHERNKHHHALSGGVIVIGASTGGPPLVEHLLALLPPEGGEAVVIVQHMSKYFTELFAERLDRVTGFRVHEAKSGDMLLPGEALVVPGGFSLMQMSEHGESSLRFMPQEESSELHEVTIDKTMSTIARCYGKKVVGILLSGMGHDGANGLRDISTSGGLALVQDPDTAAVRAMPEHALVAEGLHEAIRIEDIPERIRAYYEGKKE